MTKQLLKKCCENADGFEWMRDHVFKSSFGEMDIIQIDDNILDLLLDRCIQGVNRERKYTIINNTFIFLASVCGENTGLKVEHDGTTSGIREARIKALEFVFTR